MAYAPYQHYKQSGVNTIGLMPQHWSVRRLKFMARIQNGKDYKDVVSDEGFPVIGSGGEFAKANSYLYNGESVLLGRKGTIDKPLFINGPFWTVDTMFYTEISSDISAKYLFYCALTIDFWKYATSTALPSMTQQDLGAISFAVPDYEEQKAITRFLDFKSAQIDALISKKEALLDKLAEKRTALIGQAVTKGLDPSVPMKESGVAWLGEIPLHWRLLQLKYAVKFQRGHDLPADARTEGAIPLVSSSGISSSHDVAIAKGPGIITGRYGTIGKFTYVDSDYWPLNTTLYSIDTHENDAKYLWFMMHLLSGIFVMESKKGAVPGVDRNDLHPVLTVIPPKSEQHLIVTWLETVTLKLDRQVEKITVVIDRLKEYRSALISNAVTGKIDVSGFRSSSLQKLSNLKDEKNAQRNGL